MKIKLFFLDMEGTIFSKQVVKQESGELYPHYSLWSRLMNELGPEAMKEDIDNIKKWESGGYKNYFEWCNESVLVLKKYGLTKSLFYNVIHSITYNEGVEELFDYFQKNNIVTAIISGGFSEQARRVQERFKITHTYTAVDLFWDSNDKIHHWNMFPTDYRGKRDCVELLIQEYGFLKSECGFVGDGQNDVLIAQEVGYSFALDAHDELKKVSNYKINKITEIIDLIK